MEKVLSAISARHVLALLGFCGFVNIYAMRVNLSVALVAMVDTSTIMTNSYSETCPDLVPILSNQTVSIQQGEFKWDSDTQSLILGSFFYGYFITQIPGGVFAERYGAKWLFGFGVLITSISTILTPIAARSGVTAIVIARLIKGLAEGVTFPAMNCMIGAWVPKMERSRISTMIFMGSPVGTVIAMAASGLLSGSNFLGGWPSAFYVFGLSGCIWFLFWAFLIYEKPEDHPRISESELLQIQENRTSRYRAKKPWLSIATSIKVWALAVTHFGQNWGFYTLLTELPTYLSKILHYNIKQNGAISSLPYILQAIFAGVASIVADKMRQRNYLTVTMIRKIINSIAFYGPGVCVLLVAFIGCQPAIIITLLCVAMGLNGFMYSGFNVTHVDMSPEFAGTLMGISNCVSNISGFLAPLFVGKIISYGQTLHNWGVVFGVASAMYFFTGTIYNIFCSAELQPWGNPEPENNRKTPPENVERITLPITTVSLQPKTS